MYRNLSNTYLSTMINYVDSISIEEILHVVKFKLMRDCLPYNVDQRLLDNGTRDCKVPRLPMFKH